MSKVELGSNLLVGHIDARVLHVRIDRAKKKNAMTQEMYRGIKRAAVLADADPELDALELDPTEQFPFRHLERCRKIVVAAVNGLCHAGGLDLMLHSDVSVCSDRAKFRIPELLRGAPDPWVTSRLALSVGMARAKYLIFTAEEFDAHEAADMGLVGKVVPHEHFEEAVEHALDCIRKTGPETRARMKEDMNRRLPAADINLFRRLLLGPEMIEGMGAFLEKREPDWPRG
ncbi:MAG: enoyl-CoA hydratase/isomerase family protein [Deltaproteobacteria bacterium]|nr:enoyl-CoA hydratase/isomerase family protein [Deltaproteobacteria bacterium]